MTFAAWLLLVALLCIIALREITVRRLMSQRNSYKVLALDRDDVATRLQESRGEVKRLKMLLTNFETVAKERVQLTADRNALSQALADLRTAVAAAYRTAYPAEEKAVDHITS